MLSSRIEHKNGGDPPAFWFPPREEAEEESHEYLSWLLAKCYFRASNMQVSALMYSSCKNSFAPIAP